MAVERWTDERVINQLQIALMTVWCHCPKWAREDGTFDEVMDRIQAAIDEIESHPGGWVPDPAYHLTESYSGDAGRPYAYAGRALEFAGHHLEADPTTDTLRDAGADILAFKGVRVAK